MLRRDDEGVDKQAPQWIDTTRLLRNRVTQNTWKKSGDRNMDSSFQAELNENGGSSTRQTCSQWE